LLDLSGVWRFRELLPAPESADFVISLREGNTPLYELPQSSRITGVSRLYAKHQGMNPTGSFKDAGMTVAATFARQAGYHWVACASTGNTSASMAAYAARAGITAVVIAPVQTVILNHEHESLAAIDVYSAAGNHDYAGALTDVNPHVDGRVWNQIQPVVGHRAEQFADVASAMGDYLFRDHLGPSAPDAIRMCVPENFHRLVQIDLPEFRLINKSADTDVVQIRHLGQQISLLHEISRMYGE